jgi:hypothetical protein
MATVHVRVFLLMDVETYEAFTSSLRMVCDMEHVHDVFIYIPFPMCHKEHHRLLYATYMKRFRQTYPRIQVRMVQLYGRMIQDDLYYLIRSQYFFKWILFLSAQWILEHPLPTLPLSYIEQGMLEEKVDAFILEKDQLILPKPVDTLPGRQYIFYRHQQSPPPLSGPFAMPLQAIHRIISKPSKESQKDTYLNTTRLFWDQKTRKTTTWTYGLSFLWSRIQSFLHYEKRKS